MAAKTPSTVTRHSSGDQTKLVATFTDVDDADTWASGLPNVSDYYFSRTDDPTTQASAGVAIAESSGTFTFHPAEDNTAGDLVVFFNG